MPASINGCGTMYCGQAAAVAWEKPSFSGANPPDHDAVVCITFLMLPLVPLRPCHVFDQLGGAARELRLRWSAPLVLRAMLRSWCVLAVSLGAFVTGIMAFVVVQALLEGKPFRPASLTGPLVILGLCLLLPIGLLGLRFFRARDRAQRDIRLVIGRYAYGSSDPALWHPDVLARADVTKLVGGADPRAVAEAALREGHHSRAMLAARLLVARGDPAGAELTTRVLAHPAVQEKLSLLRKQAWRIAELLPGAKPASPAAKSAFDSILFYDGRRYSKELLDKAGGPGFVAFVRDNPTVVRGAPSSLGIRAMMALLILFIVYAGLGTPAATNKELLERLLGTAILGGILGSALYDMQTRTVAIGNRCLQVQKHRVLLDAVRSVEHQSHVGIVPIVAVSAVGALVQWPRRKGDAEDLERVLKAAIALRLLAPADDAAPGIRSSHISAHIGA